MEPTISAIFVGFKIAIFLSVLVLAFLVDTTNKKKHVHGLNIMAGIFVLVALAEFFHVMAILNPGTWNWLTIHDNLYLVTHLLTLVGGLGIIWYLRGISQNIKDYQ